MPDINPTTIARSLSEGQRAAFLRSRDEDMHYNWVGHISCYGNKAVACELYAMGLIAKPSTLAKATPVGLAVRAAILAEQEGGA